MNKLKFFQAGAITFILLGLLHLSAHFGMDKNEEASQLMLDMEALKIQLFGEHDLLKFHNGFSLMMGFMLAAYGLQQLLCAEFILQSKKALLSCIMITAFSLLIALLFFHILAYGLIAVSLGCFAIAAFLPLRSVQKSTI
jgi:hypothetical protein